MRGAEELAKRLYEACLSGSVETLDALIEEDQLILNRVNATDYFFSETPLHVAVLCGHLDFAKVLLSWKPKLATELDSQLCSPLHLASTEGHFQIVHELLRVNKDICNTRDQNGRIPLHLAVVKGRVEVIEELLGAELDPTQWKLDTNGETVLHLSIKYNKLEALKTLVKYLESNGMESLDLLISKNDDGNTILHLAADLKQVDTVKYLLGITIVKDHANDRNQKGFTALDVVEHCPNRNIKTMHIRKFLLQADVHGSVWGGQEIYNPESTQDNPPPPTALQHYCKAGVHDLMKWISHFWKTYIKVDPEWIKELRGHLITTATVMATMAYQAILSPPGGYWQETQKFQIDTSPAPSPGNSDDASAAPAELGIAGHPILDDQRKGLPNYEFFLTLNTVVLGLSLGTVLLALSGFPMKNKFFAWSLVLSLYATIFFMAYAYFVAAYLESPKTYSRNAFDGLLGAFLCIVVLVLVLNSCHFLVWLCNQLVKFYRRCKPSTSRATNNSTGEDNQTGQP